MKVFSSGTTLLLAIGGCPLLTRVTRGHQPMFRGKDCIVYNGMLYNYLELRVELENAGHTFFSQTDTEVVLAAYQHWGSEAFKKI